MSDEKKLFKVVDCMYNDYIGGNENAMEDGAEYHPFTEQELIETITNDILTEKNYLSIEGSWEVLEAKHVRFMGEAKVKEIVTARVMARHMTEGKWEWEKVNA